MDIKKKKLLIFIAVGVVIAVAVVILLINVILPQNKYNEGITAFDRGNYEEAIMLFEELGDYKDAPEKSAISTQALHYTTAVELFENGDYLRAIQEFEKADGYNDSQDKIYVSHYELGEMALKENNSIEAAKQFSISNNYNDCNNRAFEIVKELINEEDYYSASLVLENIRDSSQEYADYYNYAQGRQYLGQYDAAYNSARECFSKIKDSSLFEDLDYWNNVCDFCEAEYLILTDEISKAKEIYESLPSGFSYKENSASSRLATLNRFSSILAMEGTWTAKDGCVAKVRQLHTSTGLWDEWTTTYDSPNDKLSIQCHMNGDNTITVSGNVTFTVHTDYSSLSEYLHPRTESVTFYIGNISSPTNTFQLNDYTTMTYSNGKFTVKYSYTDDSSTMHFDYIYSSTFYYE